MGGRGGGEGGERKEGIYKETARKKYEKAQRVGLEKN